MERISVQSLRLKGFSSTGETVKFYIALFSFDLSIFFFLRLNTDVSKEGVAMLDCSV